MPKLKIKLLFLTIFVLFVANIGVVHAKNKNYSNSYKSDHYSSSHQHSQKYSSSYAPNSMRNHSSYNNAHRYAQAKVRSRSDVMSEVKQKYDAKVLKISLNEKAGVYNVRMLMPNGKVRSIQVSAR